MIRVNKVEDITSLGEPFALDFETTDLTATEAVCFSLAAIDSEGKILYGIWPESEMDSLLKNLPKNRVVFHNLKFDGKVLVNYGFDISKIMYEDTMILARLLNEEEKVGLKDLAAKLFGMQMGEFNPELRDNYVNNGGDIEFEKYAGDDAIATIKLFHFFREKLIEEDLVTAYMIEIKTVIPVMYMELNGILFSEEKCDELYDMVITELENMEDRIYEAAGRQVGLSVPGDLASLLFDDLEIPYKKSYFANMKTGARSVRAEVLNSVHESLADDDYRKDVVTDVLNWKKFNKLATSFFSGQKQSAAKWEDNRIRGSINTVSVVTGRFAGSDPNLMQLPSQPIVPGDYDTSIRAMFVPEEGNVFIDADFSQIELRLLAHFSNDPMLVKGFIEGQDFHQLTVDMTGGKIDRRAAKIANFGMLYGMSAYGFAYQAKISPQEALQYYADYAKSFPGVRQLKDDVKKAVVVNRYVRTLGGRKRRMFSDLDENSIERVFVNYLIQGGAAVVLKLSLIQLFDEFRNKECKILYPVHDELLFEVPEEKAEYYRDRIKEIMEDCITLRVPIVVEPKICRHFGEAKD